ncbi:MAG: hypothetical protein AAF941_02135 [Pseudomonadota bacterium]
MTIRIKALLWAAAIIIAALVSVSVGLGEGASYGITAGLSGAAWGSLKSDTSCGRSCLK